MTDSMKFGPEWLRNMSNDSSNSTGSSSGNSNNINSGGTGNINNSGNISGTNSTAPLGPPRFPLAEFRYGREEMLMLFDKTCEKPKILPSYKKLFNEKVQYPLALTPSTDEEAPNNVTQISQRPPWLRSPVGFISPRGISRGGSSIERGRIRPRGAFHTPFQRPTAMYEDDIRAASKERGWPERNGSDISNTGEWNGSPSSSPRKEFSSHSRNMENWRKNRPDDDCIISSVGTEGWRGGNGSGSSISGNIGSYRYPRSVSWRDDELSLGMASGGGDNSSVLSSAMQRSFSTISTTTTERDRNLVNHSNNNQMGKHSISPNQGQLDSSSNNNIPPGISKSHSLGAVGIAGGGDGAWLEADDSLPEWAMENPTDNVGGSFDASGAFHGLNDEQSCLVDSKNENRASVKQRNENPRVCSDTNPALTGSENNISGNDQIMETVETTIKPYSKENKEPDSAVVSNLPEKQYAPAETITDSNKEKSSTSGMYTPSQIYMAPPADISDQMSSVVDYMVEKLINDDDVKPSTSSSNMMGNLKSHHLTSTMHLQQATTELPSTVQHHKHPTPPLTPTQIVQNITDLWYYRDPQSKVQGPFTANEMAEWYRAGYFDENLYVRRTCDSRYAALGELVKICGNNIPFLASHLIQPLIPANEIPQPPNVAVVTGGVQSLNSGIKNMSHPILNNASSASVGSGATGDVQLELQLQLMQKQYLLRQQTLIVSKLAANESFQRLSREQQQDMIKQHMMNICIPNNLISVSALSDSLSGLNASSSAPTYNNNSIQQIFGVSSSVVPKNEQVKNATNLVNVALNSHQHQAVNMFNIPQNDFVGPQQQHQLSTASFLMQQQQQHSKLPTSLQQSVGNDRTTSQNPNDLVLGSKLRLQQQQQQKQNQPSTTANNNPSDYLNSFAAHGGNGMSSWSLPLIQPNAMNRSLYPPQLPMQGQTQGNTAGSKWMSNDVQGAGSNVGLLSWNYPLNFQGQNSHVQKLDMPMSIENDILDGNSHQMSVVKERENVTPNTALHGFHNAGQTLSVSQMQILQHKEQLKDIVHNEKQQSQNIQLQQKAQNDQQQLLKNQTDKIAQLQTTKKPSKQKTSITTTPTMPIVTSDERSNSSCKKEGKKQLSDEERKREISDEKKRKQKDEKKRQQAEDEKKRQQQTIEEEQRRQQQDERQRQREIDAHRRKAMMDIIIARNKVKQIEQQEDRSPRPGNFNQKTSVAPWSKSAINYSGMPNLAEIQKAERRERRAEEQQRLIELVNNKSKMSHTSEYRDSILKWNTPPVPVKSLSEIQAEEAKRLTEATAANAELQRRKDQEQAPTLQSGNASVSSGFSSNPFASIWNTQTSPWNGASNSAIHNNITTSSSASNIAKAWGPPPSSNSGFWEEPVKTTTSISLTQQLQSKPISTNVKTSQQTGLSKSQTVSSIPSGTWNTLSSNAPTSSTTTAVSGSFIASSANTVTTVIANNAIVSGGTPVGNPLNTTSVYAKQQSKPVSKQTKTLDEKLIKKNKKDSSTVSKAGTLVNSLATNSKNDDYRNEFTTWCTNFLDSIKAPVDVVFFISFLQDIESAYEIKEYIRVYLGESKETAEFSKQFLERRSKYKNLQRAQNAHVDDMCQPAPAINPASNDCAEAKGKGKKIKKNKMTKLDARILGFSVTAAQDRINVGDRDYGDAA